MGRLTLNMLLSFAQFEREVTGERIRDKIAASKKRGIWVGGTVPLGYRVQDRKLLVDEAEASTVRLMFERYLALDSLSALQTDLRERGIITRRRTLASGKEVGGIPLTNGPLVHLLRNRTYVGEINHKGKSYPGEHQPIVPAELFDAVQAKLTAKVNGYRMRRVASGALLLGRLYDDRGNRMTPSTVNKGKLRYRYYVSAVLHQGRSTEAGSVKRVAAVDIEAIVIDALQAKFGAELEPRTLVATHLERAVITDGSIEVSVAKGDPLVVPWSPAATTRHREIIAAPGLPTPRPMKAEARALLLRSIALGRKWLDQIVRGSASGFDAIATREDCSKRHVERTIALAFLSPDLVRAIAESRLPRGVHSAALADAPMEWSQQWQMLGLGQSAL
jgi:hypothetical protein